MGSPLFTAAQKPAYLGGFREPTRHACSPLFRHVVVKLSSNVVTSSALLIDQSTPGSVVVSPEAA
jgi:hypothetical protein